MARDSRRSRSERPSQKPTARPPRRRRTTIALDPEWAPIAQDPAGDPEREPPLSESGRSEGDHSHDEVHRWELDESEAPDSYGAQQEIRLVNGSKELSVPNLRPRKFVPPLPREDPE